MKFKKSGQIFLALAVSLGLGFGLTSCANDYTVAYLYVTGAQYNQIGAFKISDNTGNLTTIPGSPFGSGGTNPVRALVSTTGRYLYVLNAGTAAPDPNSPGNTIYTSANISVYSVGGNGTLAPQQSYQSQGYGATRFAFSSNGGFLYVMDEYSPAAGKTGHGDPLVGKTGVAAPGMTCMDASGVFHPTGDITAFSVDSNTGRLSLITNNQVQDASGNPLTYFPVGCEPIDFHVTGAYILTADTTDPVTNNRLTVFPYQLNGTNGQLTTTQNTEFVTGAQSISAIGASQSESYIYILDSAANTIWTYTVGANGLLSSPPSGTNPTANSATAAGNPIQLTTDSKNKFLYVANAGPSGGIGQANSDITGYTISTNGALAPTAPGVFPTGSSPRCILEDPSNQYLYTADFDSNTVTGHVLDPSSGVLTKMRNSTTFTTVGNPTWCVADSHTD